MKGQMMRQSKSGQKSKNNLRTVNVDRVVLEKLKPYQEMFGTALTQIVAEALTEWHNACAIPRIDAELKRRAKRKNVVSITANSGVPDLQEAAIGQ